jgi:hypothetical protein
MENADLIRVLIATKLNFASTHGDRTESALRFPLMILSSVDFPAPFSPTRPITCPSSRDRLTSASALFSAKALLIPLRSRMRRRSFTFPPVDGSIGANDNGALVARQIANTLNRIGRKPLSVEFRDSLKFAFIAGLHVSFQELIEGGLGCPPRPMLFGRKRDEEILRIPVAGMQDLRHLEEVIGRVRAVDYLLIFLGGLGRVVVSFRSVVDRQRSW